MMKPPDANDILKFGGAVALRDVLDGARHVSANGSAGAHESTAELDRSELIAQRAADVSPEPIEWLWPRRIAIGKQTLIAGEAGLGKSQILSAMAAAVTTGGDWPCAEGRAPLGNVIILSAEDGIADTIVPRLMAAGADLHRVHVVSAVRTADGKGRRAFNLQSDLTLLERKVAEIGQVRMISIDPISAYMGPKTDSHVNAVLEPVGELAGRLKVAMVCVTHPPKGSATTAINPFIGSIAFVAAARAAFMVTRDPEDKDRRLLLPVKNNLAPLGKGFGFRLEQRLVDDPCKEIVASSVYWDSEHVDVSVDEALQATDGKGASERPPGVEAEQFLRTVLAHGPLPAKDIKAEAELACVSWRTIKRVKRKLGIPSEKIGLEGGWVWTLPKGANNAEGCRFE
jgi:putative DNA primase/helicase